MENVNIEKFAREVFNITDQNLINSICNTAHVQSFEKNINIINVGDECSSVPIIYQGIVKGSMETEDGRTIIDCIMTRPGQTVAGFATLGDGSQTVFIAERTITSITNCTLIFVPVVVLQGLLKTSMEMSIIYRNILTQYTEKYLQFNTKVIPLSSYLKVQWLVNNEPQLIELMKKGIIPKQDIASYLRMTPQSFSNNWKKFK